jgi:hypothetical protein
MEGHGRSEAQMEPRVWKPVVTDSHYFVEEQGPDPHKSEKSDDPDTHESEKLDPDPN